MLFMVGRHTASREESNCLPNENMDRLSRLAERKIQKLGCLTWSATGGDTRSQELALASGEVVLKSVGK